MSRLHEVLRTTLSALDDLGWRSALVGGLAVSIHSEPRFTRDIDLAVSVPDDFAAERLIHELQQRGYRPLAVVEQTATRRLATVRLAPPGEPEEGILVDLLFASSGIEPEIVGSAGRIRVFEDLDSAVARPGHLIALKVLARDDERRPMDRADLVTLLRTASNADLDQAREALRLIAKRGYARGRDLLSDLDGLLAKTP